MRPSIFTHAVVPERIDVRPLYDVGLPPTEQGGGRTGNRRWSPKQDLDGMPFERGSRRGSLSGHLPASFASSGSRPISRLSSRHCSVWSWLPIAFATGSEAVA